MECLKNLEKSWEKSCEKPSEKSWEMFGKAVSEKYQVLSNVMKPIKCYQTNQMLSYPLNFIKYYHKLPFLLVSSKVIWCHYRELFDIQFISRKIIYFAVNKTIFTEIHDEFN